MATAHLHPSAARRPRRGRHPQPRGSRRPAVRFARVAVSAPVSAATSPAVPSCRSGSPNSLFSFPRYNWLFTWFVNGLARRAALPCRRQLALPRRGHRFGSALERRLRASRAAILASRPLRAGSSNSPRAASGFMYFIHSGGGGGGGGAGPAGWRKPICKINDEKVRVGCNEMA